MAQPPQGSGPPPPPPSGEQPPQPQWSENPPPQHTWQQQATQPMWQQTPPPAAASQGGGNGGATAALVLGILSLVFGLLLGWVPLVGLPAAGLAIVLGLVGFGVGLAARGKPSGRGQAITGVVLSAVGVLASIVWIVVQVVGFVSLFGDAEFDPYDWSNGIEGPEEGPAFDFDPDGDETDDGMPTLSGSRPPYQPYSGQGEHAFDEIREREFDEGDVVLTDVEILSDFADDFIVRAVVENVTNDDLSVNIRASVRRDGDAVGTASQSGSIEPGQQVRAHLVGYSSFDRYDDIEFTVETSGRSGANGDATDDDEMPRLAESPPRYEPHSGQGEHAFDEIREREFDEGDVVLTDVEILSDFADDFIVRAVVENVTDDDLSVNIRAWVRRDGRTIGTVSQSGSIEAGQQVRADLIGYSSFDRYDDIEFSVETTP